LRSREGFRGAVVFLFSFSLSLPGNGVAKVTRRPGWDPDANDDGGDGRYGCSKSMDMDLANIERRGPWRGTAWLARGGRAGEKGTAKEGRAREEIKDEDHGMRVKTMTSWGGE
jgi:hypothetical protein